MEEKEYIRGYDRAMFLKTCEQRGISEDTQFVMTGIVKDAGIRISDEYADKKAKELTEIINSCQTEDEILAEVDRRCEPEYYREVFMQTCESRGVSEDIRLKMFEHLDKFGGNRIDFMAAELTEIINRCQSEKEMLEALEKRMHLGHDRVKLMSALMKKNLSEDAQLEIAKIIKNARLKFSSEAGDDKAREIIEILNSSQTEEEILEKANEIKDEDVILRVMTEKGIVCMTPEQYDKYEKKQRRKSKLF